MLMCGVFPLGCAEFGEVNTTELCFAVMNDGELEPGIARRLVKASRRIKQWDTPTSVSACPTGVAQTEPTGIEPPVAPVLRPS